MGDKMSDEGRRGWEHTRKPWTRFKGFTLYHIEKYKVKEGATMGALFSGSVEPSGPYGQISSRSASR